MTKRYLGVMLFLTIFLIISGCAVPAGSGGGGYSYGGYPYGPYQAHLYRYYPSSGIYFDTMRGLYFYYRNGRWRTSVSLPAGIRIDRDDYVNLKMNTDRPYRHHRKIRKKYPPGYRKYRNERRDDRDRRYDRDDRSDRSRDRRDRYDRDRDRDGRDHDRYDRDRDRDDRDRDR